MLFSPLVHLAYASLFEASTRSFPRFASKCGKEMKRWLPEAGDCVQKAPMICVRAGEQPVMVFYWAETKIVYGLPFGSSLHG